MVAATSFSFHFHLPYQIRRSSAPIYSFFLSLPWARKISLVGAQIFIFIDDAKVQKIQMQNNSFPRLFFKKFNFIFVKY